MATELFLRLARLGGLGCRSRRSLRRGGGGLRASCAVTGSESANTVSDTKTAATNFLDFI